MKIIGYTCTYNEAEMVPYVMPYVEAFGYDKFIVYDNESTDNTVELLSQYPFVEIRTYSTGESFDDAKRLELMKISYTECLEYLKFVKGNELVWFTWTDFDEVLFPNVDGNFRDVLEGDYINRGYNCFYGNMINLFMPEGEPVKKLMYGRKFVHSVPGVRGSVWIGGMKPTMLAVNDFSTIQFTHGNHYAIAKTFDNIAIKSYDDCCRLYGFHLKFIDKEILRKKWETYSKRAGSGEGYIKYLSSFYDVYERQYSTSFPLSEYFLQDYFNSKLYSKEIRFNGIMSIKHDE